MHLISFTLLFLAITSVIYGTTEVWKKTEYDQDSSNVQLAAVKEKPRFTGGGAVGRGDRSDLVSSPPDVN